MSCGCFYKLPFVPDTSQIIYIEDVYNGKVNSFIQRYFYVIEEILKKKGLTFVYLPFSHSLETHKRTILKRTFPMLPTQEYDEIIKNWNKETTATFSRKLCSFLSEGTKANEIFLPMSGFLQCTIELIDEEFQFYFTPLKEGTDEDLLQKIRGIRNESLIEGCYYAVDLNSGYEVDNYADIEFRNDMQIVADDIRKQIQMLKQEGYYELLIHTLGDDLMEDISNHIMESQLSRLEITDDFKILLPDFHVEIVMTPIPKAVFILFLRHPEGVFFKSLPNYRTELMEIYKLVSSREDYESMYKSILDVTNPSCNRINEKCSRIREAFLLHFDDRLTRNYCITGKRGEKKEILIDRQLVSFPESINCLCLTDEITHKMILEKEKKVTYYLDKLRGCLRWHMFERGLRLSNELIRLSDCDYRGYFYCAIFYLELGEYEKAEEGNTLVLDYAPTNPNAHYNRAEARLFLGKYVEGLNDINLYFKLLQPGTQPNKEGFYIRGLLEEKLEMNELAEADFKKAKECGFRGIAKLKLSKLRTR